MKKIKSFSNISHHKDRKNNCNSSAVVICCQPKTVLKLGKLSVPHVQKPPVSFVAWETTCFFCLHLTSRSLAHILQVIMLIYWIYSYEFVSLIIVKSCKVVAETRDNYTRKGCAWKEGTWLCLYFLPQRPLVQTIGF